METDKTDNKPAFDNKDHIRNPPHFPPPIPQKHWEEKVIIRNLNKIDAIDRRTRELKDQIRENRFAFMNILVWEVELEKLSNRKERLLNKNAKLHKALGEKPPMLQLQYPKIQTQEKQKTNPNIGYAPIVIPSISPYFKDMQLEEIEYKLSKVYERKDALFQKIMASETNIADQRTRDELDELTRREATLLTKAEDLRMSREVDRLTNKQTLEQDIIMQTDKTEKHLEEISSVPQWNNQEEIAEALDSLDRDEEEEKEIENLDEQEALDEIQDIRDGLQNDKDDLDRNDERAFDNDDFNIREDNEQSRDDDELER